MNRAMLACVDGLVDSVCGVQRCMKDACDPNTTELWVGTCAEWARMAAHFARQLWPELREVR
jgi:hypothetical protein